MPEVILPFVLSEVEFNLSGTLLITLVVSADNALVIVTAVKVGDALVATFCIDATNGHLLDPIEVDCIEFKLGKVVNV